MERTNQFDLQHEVNQFIEKINTNELLSSLDISELKDHFLSQIEELKNTGLSIEEAFIISKMRFGKPEMIQEEYEKSKPFEKWKKYFMISCLSYFVISNIYSLIHFMIIGLILLFKNNFVLHLPFIRYFYLLLFLGGILLFFRWLFLLIKNGKISNYKKYIPLIPLSFLILYPIRTYTYPFAVNYLMKTSKAFHINNLFLSYRIIFLIFIAIMIIIAFWGIKKQWLYKPLKT